MLPFTVKICGVTSVTAAVEAVAAGADAIGLNFCSASKRCVKLSIASEICRVVASSSVKVGVFVNESPTTINTIAETCNLDLVQLHGDEDADAYASIVSLPIIKAISWRGLPSDVELTTMWMETAREKLVAFLVDAYDPFLRGGTGKTVDWEQLSPRPEKLGQRPLILAGGLNPDNVFRAIEIARPDGVDTASGVEESSIVRDSNTVPQKSPEKMRAFVQAARAGFATIALKN